MELKVNEIKRDTFLYILAIWSDSYNSTTKIRGTEENLDIKKI